MNTKTLLWMVIGFLGMISLAQAQSIRIDFADPSVPDINVSGRAAGPVYGVSEAPALARARAEVALKTPPPVIEAFAIKWEPVRVVQETILRNSPPESSGYFDFPGLAFYFNLDEPRTQTIDSSTDYAAHPVYDTDEYLAELAQWKREQVKARMILGN